MIGKLQCLVLDCPDPAGLARFYAGLLGGEVDRPDPRWSLGAGWSTLHLDGGTVLCFQGVADHRPPRWPDPEHPSRRTWTSTSRTWPPPSARCSRSAPSGCATSAAGASTPTPPGTRSA